MNLRHLSSGVLLVAPGAAGGGVVLPGRVGEPHRAGPGPVAGEPPAVPGDPTAPQAAPPVPGDERGVEAPAPPAEAILLINVVHASSGLATTGDVVLWRLGHPGDDVWTEGDEVVGRGRAEGATARARFEGLPPGRYRAQLTGKRLGTEDPPEFRYEGGTVELTLPMTYPGSFRAWLRLFDEEGRAVASAERGRGESTNSWERSRDPHWALRRARRDGGPLPEIGGRGIVRGNRSWGWNRSVAGERGFDLGVFGESSELWRHSHRRSFGTEAGVLVDVAVSGDLLADTDFVAPAPSREFLLRGLPVEEADLPRVRFEAKTAALPLPPGGDPGAWRTVPVEVVAWVTGVGRWKRALTLDGTAPRWEEAGPGDAGR